MVTVRGKTQPDSEVNPRYYITAKPNWTISKCFVLEQTQYTLYRGNEKIGRYTDSYTARMEAERLAAKEHKEAA